MEIEHLSPVSPREWVMGQLDEPGALMKLVRYLLFFWTGCLVTGFATGYGLIHSGMKAQNAFYSGLTVSLLPVVVVAIMAGIYWWLSIMRF